MPETSDDQRALHARVVMMLKAPLEGYAKTRLASALGAPGAQDAYEELLKVLFDSLEDLPDMELRVSPKESLKWAQSMCRRPDWSVQWQGDGNLGERLERAARETLIHHSAVILIGADCPYIQPEDIAKAFAALETHEAVIGPARDGGYWLLGLKKPFPDLFTRMPWSTHQVFQETVHRLERMRVPYQRLRLLEDVDELGAWQRFQSNRSTD